MIVYADTSALAKLILQEAGTAEMVETAQDAEAIASAVIGYVELRAALAAAIRDGRIPPAQRDNVVLSLERIWDGVSEIGVDGPLIRHAGDLAENMRLRGYDAVHLAALQQLGGVGDVVFACWDSELRRAARALGYRLIPA